MWQEGHSEERRALLPHLVFVTPSAESHETLRVAGAGLQNDDLAALALSPLSVVHPWAFEFAPSAVLVPAPELVPSRLDRARATRYRHRHERFVHRGRIRLIVLVGVGSSSSSRRISRFEDLRVTGGSGGLFGHLYRRVLSCRELLYDRNRP